MRNFSMKKLGTPIAGAPGTDRAKPGFDGAVTGLGVAPCCFCSSSVVFFFSSSFFFGLALGLRGATLVGRWAGGLTTVDSGAGWVPCCVVMVVVGGVVAVVDAGVTAPVSAAVPSGQSLRSSYGHRSTPEAGDSEEPRPTASAPVTTRLVISFRFFIRAACLLPPWAGRTPPPPRSEPSRGSVAGSYLVGATFSTRNRTWNFPVTRPGQAGGRMCPPPQPAGRHHGARRRGLEPGNPAQAAMLRSRALSNPQLEGWNRGFRVIPAARPPTRPVTPAEAPWGCGIVARRPNPREGHHERRWAEPEHAGSHHAPGRGRARQAGAGPARESAHQRRHQPGVRRP